MIRACVFAHYDKNNMVDDYVYYYLNELLKVVEKIVFVTVSDISVESAQQLKKSNIDVLKRDNIGYDFYSYKVGILSLDFDMYDELIICNDSVFGPIISLIKVFEQMNEKKCDFWGVTESYEYSYHLQSYFVCFKSNVLKSKSFHDFWVDVKGINDKSKIIQLYEIGLTKVLIDNNFISSSYVKVNPTIYDKSIILINWHISSKYKLLRILKMPFSRYYWNFIFNPIDITIELWDKIIKYNSMPFIKKSLFSLDRDIEKKYNYNNVISSISSYPIELITNYLSRNIKNGK